MQIETKNSKGETIHRNPVFVDIETTGLSIAKSEIIEIAFIEQLPEGSLHEFEWKLPLIRPEDADPKALEINGYDADVWAKEAQPRLHVYGNLQSMWAGKILVGSAPAFDYMFLHRDFQKYLNTSPRFHYKPLDVTMLGYAYLGKVLSLEALYKELGGAPIQAHRALNDCRMAYFCYKQLTMRAEASRNLAETFMTKANETSMTFEQYKESILKNDDD